MDLQEKATTLTYGQASVTLSYNLNQNWIYADWIGVHSLVSIQKGMGVLLEWFQETGAPKYLSDNSNLVGGWDTANDWLAEEWTPRAVDAGMRYVAHVLAPGFYGKLSMEALQPRLVDKVTIRLFEFKADAEEWLASL